MIQEAIHLVFLPYRNRKRFRECLELIYKSKPDIARLDVKALSPAVLLEEISSLSQQHLSASHQIEVLSVLEKAAHEYKMKAELEKLSRMREAIEKHI